MVLIAAPRDQELSKPIRIVGLCGSVANAKDLGDWIGNCFLALAHFVVSSYPSDDCRRSIGWTVLFPLQRPAFAARAVHHQLRRKQLLVSSLGDEQVNSNSWLVVWVHRRHLK